VKTLRLEGFVEENVANCQIWGEPTLFDAAGQATRLTSLTPTSQRVGWGQMLLDHNWQNHPLAIGEHVFSFGFWVHADSELAFRLDGQYTRFEAWCGEDRDRAVGKLRFRVLSGEAPPIPAYVADLATRYPYEMGRLLDDAGLNGVLDGFAPRATTDWEQALLARCAARAPSVALSAARDALAAAAAPPGDARWLALYARWLRYAEARRPGFEAAGEALAAAGVEADSPRWTQLRWQALLAAERDEQWATLARDVAHRSDFAHLAAQTLRPEALILPEDRDPLDVVLRRTGALAESLGRGTALDDLRRAASALAPADVAARRKLFDAVCAVRRSLAFARPEVDFDQVLFVKRHRAVYEHMCDQYYGITAQPGGGVYVLEHAFSEQPVERDVLANAVVSGGRLDGQALSGGPVHRWRLNWDGERRLNGDETIGGAFLSPSLSYDGKTIYFAYVECRGDRLQQFHTDATKGHWDAGRAYHLFKVGVDGTGLKQLTDGTWNDFDPCALPDGRVAFISERRGGYLRCGRACPNYNLYDMAPGGDELRCLSVHETNEWNPSVTHDGRIIYTRWDYVDRFGCTAHLPWITDLDGEDSRSLHGNFAPRALRPDMELDVRAVPGSAKFTATAAPHHGQAFGSLVMIDPHIPDDDAMAPVKRITPDVGFPESQGGAQAYGGCWPLSEDCYLCVYDAGVLGTPGVPAWPRWAGEYGIYLLDSFGNKELVWRDPDIGCGRPMPLRATAAPRSPALDPNADALHLAVHREPITPGDGGEGTLAVVNVYDALYPWPKDTKITALRVLQVLPMTVPSGFPPFETGLRIATAGDSVNCVRWVLGTTPVEADGSAHFVAPANRELLFQALDADGLAVQSMRSATYLRQGERRVCAGCHESKYRAPSLARTFPTALQRDAARLVPDVDGSKPFSYPRLVQPVLDRACQPCHEQNAGKAPNLGREPLANHWYASYNSLLPYAFTNYGNGMTTTPGHYGARASRLWAMLEKGHHGVRLSDEDRHRLALWLDCASMFYGVYEKEGGEAQLRGEVATPTLY